MRIISIYSCNNDLSRCSRCPIGAAALAMFPSPTFAHLPIARCPFSFSFPFSRNYKYIEVQLQMPSTPFLVGSPPLRSRCVHNIREFITSALGFICFYCAFAAAICSFDLWLRADARSSRGKGRRWLKGEEELQRGERTSWLWCGQHDDYLWQHCCLQQRLRACAKERIKRINKRIQIKFLINELPLNLYINYNFYSWRLCFLYDDGDWDDKS